MNSYRVRAFTIIEVTIAMLITALLTGITYTSYVIINKSYGTFQCRNQDMADLTRLDLWLKKDFSRADLIFRDNDGVSLSDSGRLIQYRFAPDGIVRTYLRSDTFKFKSDSLITSFENKPVEQLNAIAEDNRLDEVAFEVIFENQKIPYHYHKQYSSVNLIKRNPNAVN